MTELSRAEFADLGEGDAARRSRAARTTSSSTRPRETTVFAVQRAARARRGAGPEPPSRATSIDVDADVSALPEGPHADRRRRHDGRREARRDGRARRGRADRRRGWRLELEDDLQESYERASVVVHANVAARDARRDGQAAARLRPRRRAPSSASRSRRGRSRTSSRADAVRRRLGARGARQRGALGRGADALRRPGRATARTSLGTDADGKAYVEFGDGDARLAPAVRLEQRPRALPEGPRRRRAT